MPIIPLYLQPLAIATEGIISVYFSEESNIVYISNEVEDD